LYEFFWDLEVNAVHRTLTEALLIVTLIGFPWYAEAQTWTGSGSNGSDGPLNINASTPGVTSGVLLFDPVALNLDTDGDNVYHFTTITIEGVTVRFLPQKLRRNGPLVWLATGDVSIGGHLFLFGEDGHAGGTNFSLRRPSVPGPGGYPGGVGGRQGASASQGFGPGGALPADGTTNIGCNAGHAEAGRAHEVNTGCLGKGGTAYGTGFVQPLIGGSGGSGGHCLTPEEFGAGGGAGGGAVRISTDGTLIFRFGGWGIFVNGGAGGTGCSQGGGGSGGSIHLQAGQGITFEHFSNQLRAFGGQDASGIRAGSGRIRMDTPSGTVTGTTLIEPPPVVGFLVNVPLPVIPTVKVTTVDGVSVPQSPQGLYTIPDLSINNTNPVTVNVEATEIPLGTQLTLIITTEGTTVSDQVVTTTPLAGTVANSAASATVTFPPNVTRFFARAVW
jgi:hypothetical protein